MSDDLLSALGREQREDLERDDEASGRPFDGDEQAAILDAVFDRVEPAPSKVVPLLSRRSALAGGLLTLAAAATVAWWVWPSSEPELLANVPAYTFTELEGGIAEVRSDPGKPTDAAVPELQLRPASKIDWVLTPAEPIEGPIGVALLARSEAGSTQFVPRLEVEVSPHGALRLRGRLDQHVALVPGTWTLTLFIAPPEQLPSEADAVDEPERWRSLSLRAIIVTHE